MRSRSPPLKGRGRGGVSNILRVNDIQTPPLAPPLEGRGAAAPTFETIMVFGVDSYRKMVIRHHPMPRARPLVAAKGAQEGANTVHFRTQQSASAHIRYNAVFSILHGISILEFWHDC